MVFPAHRPRRLRQNASVRALVRETHLAASQLVQPLFVRDDISEPVAISSMPGVVQHTHETLRRAAEQAIKSGVGALMVFGIPATRDAQGSAGDDPHGVLNRALRSLRADLGPEAVLIADLCLDEFTDHGHCGVLSDAGSIDNDATLERYQGIALEQVAAGATMLGLSGMMDGQVAAVRQSLDDAGHLDTLLLAYAVKYASAFYGPFREATGSTLTGDRRTYQQDPANIRESLRELDNDLREGADVVMVKPALAYLDVISAVAQRSSVPVWAYQVSGEFAMVEAAAAQGWLDRDQVIAETLLSIVRAGAGTVVTYWATEMAERLR